MLDLMGFMLDLRIFYVPATVVILVKIDKYGLTLLRVFPQTYSLWYSSATMAPPVQFLIYATVRKDLPVGGDVVSTFATCT